jgi:hypothetical protein
MSRDCPLLACSTEPPRSDGLIDNYCSGKEAAPLPMSPSATIVNDTLFSEDRLKTVLKGWLEAQEWLTYTRDGGQNVGLSKRREAGRLMR